MFRTGEQKFHNTYFHDVQALGMCFLQMATLLRPYELSQIKNHIIKNGSFSSWMPKRFQYSQKVKEFMDWVLTEKMDCEELYWSLIRIQSMDSSTMKENWGFTTSANKVPKP